MNSEGVVTIFEPHILSYAITKKEMDTKKQICCIKIIIQYFFLCILFSDGKVESQNEGPETRHTAIVLDARPYN
jgi:hypothetical protein